MRIALLVLSLITPLACCAPQRVEKPAATRPTVTVVGSVYGKPVTATDIELTTPIDPNVQFDARDDDKWDLMGRILTAFGKPVEDRFVEAKHIDATADEIKAGQDRMRQSNQWGLKQMEEQLANVNTELASSNLRDEDKTKLEKKRAYLENIVTTSRDVAKQTPSEDLARRLIVAWKIERELQRMYGGRVIFQQAGLEALDARRRLFEEAENNGDLKFEDAGVRHMFYYYYANMNHAVAGEDALEKAWFRDDSN
jgi:hypothetical protein